jgi:hypothetical protein
MSFITNFMRSVRGGLRCGEIVLWEVELWATTRATVVLVFILKRYAGFCF